MSALSSDRARKLAAGGRRASGELDAATPATERPAPAGSAIPVPARSSAAGPRTRPFRLTVDVPPTTHATLSRWVIDAEVRSGRNVDKRAVFLALLDRLFTDPDLAAAIESAITATAL
jgi:hypothetical protein